MKSICNDLLYQKRLLLEFIISASAAYTNVHLCKYLRGSSEIISSRIVLQIDKSFLRASPDNLKSAATATATTTITTRN